MTCVLLPPLHRLVVTKISATAQPRPVRRDNPLFEKKRVALPLIQTRYKLPLLSRAKRRVEAHLKSTAMNADAKQTEFYLSAILLGGLLLNAPFDLWWADSVCQPLHASKLLQRRA